MQPGGLRVAQRQQRDGQVEAAESQSSFVASSDHRRDECFAVYQGWLAGPTVNSLIVVSSG